MAKKNMKEAMKKVWAAARGVHPNDTKKQLKYVHANLKKYV